MTDDEVAQCERELQAQDLQHRARLAVAQNVATNGRLFCAMLFTACLTMFVVRSDPAFAALAVVAAVPVGASCIVDQISHTAIRSIAALAVYACAAFVALQSIIMIAR